MSLEQSVEWKVLLMALYWLEILPSTLKEIIEFVYSGFSWFWVFQCHVTISTMMDSWRVHDHCSTLNCGYSNANIN
jgi:hypothetical protein